MLSPYIAQAFVYGDSLRSCTVAIIVVEPEKLKKWAEDNGKSPKSLEKSINDTGFK